MAATKKEVRKEKPTVAKHSAKPQANSTIGVVDTKCSGSIAGSLYSSVLRLNDKAQNLESLFYKLGIIPNMPLSSALQMQDDHKKSGPSIDYEHKYIEAVQANVEDICLIDLLKDVVLGIIGGVECFMLASVDQPLNETIVSNSSTTSLTPYAHYFLELSASANNSLSTIEVISNRHMECMASEIAQPEVYRDGVADVLAGAELLISNISKTAQALENLCDLLTVKFFNAAE